MARKPRLPADMPGPMTERFDLMRFTDRLIGDLELLRAGKISMKEARVRAELARQVLRSVHYVITAQKFLEGAAKPVAISRDLPPA